MARYALVIGISEYNDPFTFLDKADQDAAAVRQKLAKEGGYKVTSLTSSEHGAVKAVDLYKELKKFLEQESSQSEALIYFTGHGFQTVNPFSGEKADGYLATSDCIVELNDSGQVVNQKNGLPFTELNKLIQGASCSSLVVVLDACHSGGFVEQNSINTQAIGTSLSSFKVRNNYYCITPNFSQAAEQ